MIRNLKILLAAAMALAAVGAFSATAAQAHTPAKFHCHAEPCAITLEPDGAHPSATAHHVFVVKNSVGETVSFTCDTLDGYATSNTKTTETLTFTNLDYTGCKAAGQPATVRMNGCHYDILANTAIYIQCLVGSMELEITGTKCIATVGSQGPLGGLTHHNSGFTSTPPLSSTTHMTLEFNVPGWVVTWDKLAGGVCPIDITKTPITGSYTTGNTTATGFKDPAGTPADKHSSIRTDFWWSNTSN